MSIRAILEAVSTGVLDCDTAEDAIIRHYAFSALAAGTRSAETNEDLAQSEGCQSGPKGNAQPAQPKAS